MKKWVKWLIGIAVFVILAAAGMGWYLSSADVFSVAIIGGADGPTSIFVAGKVGKEVTKAYLMRLTVCGALILSAGTMTGYYLYRWIRGGKGK